MESNWAFFLFLFKTGVFFESASKCTMETKLASKCTSIQPFASVFSWPFSFLSKILFFLQKVFHISFACYFFSSFLSHFVLFLFSFLSLSLSLFQCSLAAFTVFCATKPVRIQIHLHRREDIENISFELPVVTKFFWRSAISSFPFLLREQRETSAHFKKRNKKDIDKLYLLFFSFSLSLFLPQLHFDQTHTHRKKLLSLFFYRDELHLHFRLVQILHSLYRPDTSGPEVGV